MFACAYRLRNENNAKEKETANAISLSEGCAYTPVMVELRGVEPLSEKLI